jgi:hypothetical protein
MVNVLLETNKTNSTSTLAFSLNRRFGWYLNDRQHSVMCIRYMVLAPWLVISIGNLNNISMVRILRDAYIGYGISTMA